MYCFAPGEVKQHIDYQAEQAERGGEPACIMHQMRDDNKN